MIQIESELRYTETHEWAREEDDGSLTIGISDPAQAALGKVIFVDLPEVGDEVKAQQEVGLIESLDSSIEICAPLAGEIIEVNTLLQEKPELINADAYHDGWVFKMMPYDLEGLKDMLDSQLYEELVEELEL